MVRILPKKRNPLIDSDHAPSYEDLLSRRRLGKTHLAVKREQVGTSSATKPENLGMFEYAHLRTPLPKDLKGSEIFPSHAAQQHPDTYFLMRRSKDGYVSATGMFKIAFPWSKLEEERAEREYVKSLTGTSEDEIAGNVWVSPELALQLAKEYQMYDWVRALLDPAEIFQSPSIAKKQITSPPKFELPPLETPKELAPTRGRPRRSASPAKKAVSPRKPRETKGMKEASAATTSAANAALQSALEITAAESESTNGILDKTLVTNGEQVVEQKKLRSKPKKGVSPSAEEEKFKFEVESTAGAVDDVQTSETTIRMEMSVNLPDAPSAAETEEMIAKAKEMVEDAIKQQQIETETLPSAIAVKKRKQDQVSEAEDGEQPSDLPSRRAKKVKVLEEKLKRERVRNRALVGVTATLALAAAIPYFF